MRIGLTAKLLMVLGLASAVSVMAMALAARWSFQHGFLDYLGQQELKLLEPLIDTLVQAHSEHGSWDFLARDPGAWPRFVDDAMAPVLHGVSKDPRLPQDARKPGDPQQPFPPMPPHPGPPKSGPPHPYGAPPFGPPGFPPHEPRRMPSHPAPLEMQQPGPHDAPAFAPPGGPPPGPGFRPPPPRAGHLVARLRLLDNERRQVAGVAEATADELLTPLVSDGVVKGWLGLAKPPWLEDKLAQRFNSQHNRSLFWISLAALTLAVLLGSLFGETILRRIRTVAAGARQLAKGNYRTRITRKGRDELSGLAEDFNHLAMALERSEQLRRSAMADVSHELRTPLAVAFAELDALIDGIRPCTGERLEQLKGRLLALGRLLDDLYDLALSDTGALEYRHEALDLVEVIRAAVSDVRESFTKKGLEVHMQIESTLPMEGDRGRLRQVMDNLLANSLRYTDPGGFTQIVAVRRGDEILITVEDTSPGVVLNDLERLFDRFYRVEASRSRAKGGAGLGLAICRNIVEAHRGSISARPADSGGLAIDVRLPASEE